MDEIRRAGFGEPALQKVQRHIYKRLCLAAGFIFILALSACQQATPSPSPTPSPQPSLTASPTATPSPTRTRPPLPTPIPSQTSTPTPVPTITPGPSPTSTRQPPLTDHTWLPGRVLLQMGVEPGNASQQLGPSPDFILYASGQLIVRQCNQTLCSYLTQMLPHRETCTVLNTIDQLGFFDYDPGTFHSPSEGGQATFIQVNAWRQAEVRISQLGRWLVDPNWFNKELNCSHCTEIPLIQPALRDTYTFLSTYRPAGMKSYQPDQLAIWISKPFVEGPPAPWLLTVPTLADLYERSKCSAAGQSQAVILSGSEAVQVAEFTNKMLLEGYAPMFTEGSLTLQVVTQWLLPEQVPAACGEARGSLPGKAAPTPAFSLSCSPQDGLIPTPSPTPLWFH